MEIPKENDSGIHSTAANTPIDREERADRLLTLIGTVGGETWTNPQFREGKFIGIESTNRNEVSVGLGIEAETKGNKGFDGLTRASLEYSQTPSLQAGTDARVSLGLQTGRSWHLAKGYAVTTSLTGSIDLVHSVMIGTFTEDLGVGTTAKLPFLDIPDAGVSVGIRSPSGWAIEVKGDLNVATRSFGQTRGANGISAISYPDENGNIVTVSTVSEYAFNAALQGGAGLVLTVPLQKIH